jgi:phage FluMu gp28-like protein
MFKRFRIDIYRAIKDGLNFDLETMRALFDAETWASAYECQFIDDDSSLFSISLIKSCVDEKLKYYTPSSSKTIWMGYDIGRVKDSSALAGVLANKDGIYELAILETLRKAKFDTQKEFLKTMLKRYPLAQLKIDKTGIGANLSENIQDIFKSRVTPVHFTAPIKEYMSLNLKKMFEDKTIRIPNDPLLIADIHSIKRKAGARGFLYDSERNSHGHADRYWALALATSSLETGIKKKKRGGVWIM